MLLIIAFGCWLDFSRNTFFGGAAELVEGLLPTIVFYRIRLLLCLALGLFWGTVSPGFFPLPVVKSSQRSLALVMKD